MIFRIAAFLDGRPGHEKQTLGVIRALSSIVETEVHEIRVESRFRGALAAISEYKDLASTDITFDLAIGTGSKTHPCIIYSGLGSKTMTVTCMSPERFFLPFFDLCLVPYHDSVSDSQNIFRTAGPPGMNIDRKAHEKTEGLVLIGGTDEKSHFWDQDEILEMITAIIKESPETRWTVSTSPRTPESMDEALKNICEDSGADYRPFSSTPRGWLESEYDRCKTVWVTADSISMVYEALSAGCRVGVIPVRWKKSESKFTRSLGFLDEKGLVSFYPEKPDPDTEMETFDEAARCAEEIIRRWKEKNSK